MRLKRATLSFAGAAAAIAVTTMAASPAWACNDRDPGLKLSATCGANGPNWMVTNPNTWGAVPMSWMDNTRAHSDRRIQVPAAGSVSLPTHASFVTVVAYNPETGQPWKNHGAFGVKKCAGAPKPNPSKPNLPPPAKPGKPTAKPGPTKSRPQTSTPVPTAPSGEARPATPVKAQPKFTG